MQSRFKRNKIQSSQAIDILTVCLQTGVASCLCHDAFYLILLRYAGWLAT